VIIALAIIGFLIVAERLYKLTMVERGINRQRKSDSPNPDNPLGRIIEVYTKHKTENTDVLERKIDEAILKETPSLEKRLAIIKILAGIAPLLGLLGTVTGMIATFQSITLFGAGDPKLMAGGISQALITTVLGLTAAIPLILLHSVVASKSKRCVNILEEQSAGFIARHAEKEA
jgi:biopolymer transport protein ExbB